MANETESMEVIERARRGDQEAFFWLFQKHQSRMAVFIRYHMGETLRAKMEIDDVMQELFLRAFRDIANFNYQGPGSFLRWLFQIARHTIQDLARYQDRQKRQAEAEVQYVSSLSLSGFQPAYSQTPSRILFQKERLARLLQSLDSLSQYDRELILQAKVEGLTIGEIAERTDISKAQISLGLHRALKRLRTTLEAEA